MTQKHSAMDTCNNLLYIVDIGIHAQHSPIIAAIATSSQLCVHALYLSSHHNPSDMLNSEADSNLP